MRIGVPKEIKAQENRAGLTPPAVHELVRHGHEVLVQSGCGTGIGCDDAQYSAAGAHIVPSAADVFGAADMVVKVKEPQPSEIAMLRRGQLLFTYLHLAPDPQQTQGLLASGCTAIAYETITDAHGRLPLLAPMSEVAGRMAVQVGATALQRPNGGRGVLLGGVPGVAPGKVVVLGGGVVGTHAAKMAVGLGAEVTILDKSLPRLRELDDLFGGRVKLLYAAAAEVEQATRAADLIIGAVLVPGAAAPKLLSRAQVAQLQSGTVLVDVAIDQGGCFETSHATTHAEPTYVVDGVVHYCVANMPGGVPRTSTWALNNATLPFTLALANKGWRQACQDDPHLREGLNIHDGQLTYRAVGEALGLPWVSAEDLLRG
ncbi:alanine dehydrogenase [Roseateles sp. BYS180W]|uniref:Alanine dehydrogenase n=1 Tax=Roseateles rivi TaxID=3299028 RepID=A0ABW7FYT8_9BURK